MTVQTITGDAAKAIINTQLAAHEGGIAQRLAGYDAASAVSTWHGAIRAVEEFINLPRFGLDDRRRRAWLLSAPMGHALEANSLAAQHVRSELQRLFGPAVAARFFHVMLHLSGFAIEWSNRGQDLGEGFNLDTVGAAVEFLQARRRHFVSLLYLMPQVCQGTAELDPDDAFDVMLPLVEHCCISVTSWHQKAVLAEVHPDFALYSDGHGGHASHSWDPLEGDFLEPERASIMTMHAQRGDQIAPVTAEPVDPRLIFSPAELRNNVRFIQAVYEGFGLNDDVFSALSRVIIAVARHCDDAYFINLDAQKFRAILAAQTAMPAAEMERLLVNRPDGYAACTNAYEPFIMVGGRVVSNVVLLSRFLYAFKNVHLGSRRRFQIHAGFIFEDQVKADLVQAGFTVTAIKRIARKEFDVVATYAGAIYNFQCKNNWVDLSTVERDRKRFARFNRGLVRYYRSALRKEAGREGLLTAELGLTSITHFVVSRFPVITDDRRILNHNTFPARLAAIAAAAGGMAP